MNGKAFFDAVRASLFGGHLAQAQVDGILRILHAFALYGTGDVRHLAYILATAFHETARRMHPVREALGETDAQTVARLEAAWRKGALKWVKTPYWRPDANGRSWFGRGDVQLTHEANYRRLGGIVGVDLVSDPGRALDPDISARILVEGLLAGVSLKGDFTGRCLEEFIHDDHLDYVGARRAVNGTDAAKTIAGYAQAFEAALRAAGAETAEPSPHPTPEPIPAPPAPRAPSGAMTMFNTIVQSIGRHVLTGLAGALVAKGYVDESSAQAIVGGLLALIGVAASYADKLQRA